MSGVVLQVGRPRQADVDALRGLLDLMGNFESNDQRARYLLTSNWMRDRDALIAAEAVARIRGVHEEAGE